VNVAARIERLTKVYGVPVLISDETRGLLGDAFARMAVSPPPEMGAPRPTCYWTPSVAAMSSS
jgi:class 3 adenylate cyclase